MVSHLLLYNKSSRDGYLHVVRLGKQECGEQHRLRLPGADYKAGWLDPDAVCWGRVTLSMIHGSIVSSKGAHDQ